MLSRHADPIEHICFSPDGSRLASVANGAVLVWRVESGTLTHVYDRVKSQRKNGTVIPDDVSEIGEISWDEGGQRLAIGEGSNKVNTASDTRDEWDDTNRYAVCYRYHRLERINDSSCDDK